jgi:hypothetical protein
MRALRTLGVAAGLGVAVGCGSAGDGRGGWVLLQQANGILDGATDDELLRSLREARVPAAAAGRRAGDASGDAITDGTISGLIVTDLPAVDSLVEPTHDHQACRPFRQALLTVKDRAVRDAVVWLVGDTAAPPSDAPRRVAIRLGGCRLAPRVVALGAGGTLLLQSGDAMSSRLRFVDAADAARASVASTNRAGSGTAVVPRAVATLNDAGQVVPLPAVGALPGLVEVRDDLHPWIRAWVVVAPHAHVAVTGADGAFRFEGLAPGRYTVVAWHERTGLRAMPVRVDAGVATRLELSLPAR